jgi:methylmalonyl-CoA/ethylmalonyl-CoA epimerase
MIRKIDHIAVIVKDADEALKVYSEMFDFEVVEETGEPGGEFKAVLIRAGDVKLELLQPLTDHGSFAKFLRERGGGLHHASFATDNINQDLKILKEQGRRLINEEPMSLPNGDKVAFIHPSAAENVLIELVQKAKPYPEMPDIRMT